MSHGGVVYAGDVEDSWKYFQEHRRSRFADKAS
jgi:hypothetical protein